MDQERDLQRYDRQHDPGWLLALSDGVFAIILTLLGWRSMCRTWPKAGRSRRRWQRSDRLSSAS
jgi:hypothetical protein